MAGSGTAHMRNTVDAVLTVRDLTVEFRVAKDKIVKAVSGLSFDVIKGETLAIVGESGCGKTTLAQSCNCHHRIRVKWFLTAPI